MSVAAPLVPPEQSALLSASSKYDWGAQLSDIDISSVMLNPELFDKFRKAKGIYARVEAGDALFIPKRTWHAVVSLEPSISLAIFGLTVPEIIFEGGYNEIKHALHKLHLYRWGNCTCHGQSIFFE